MREPQIWTVGCGLAELAGVTQLHCRDVLLRCIGVKHRKERNPSKVRLFKAARAWQEGRLLLLNVVPHSRAISLRRCLAVCMANACCYTRQQKFTEFEDQVRCSASLTQFSVKLNCLLRVHLQQLYLSSTFNSENFYSVRLLDTLYTPSQNPIHNSNMRPQSFQARICSVMVMLSLHFVL